MDEKALIFLHDFSLLGCYRLSPVSRVGLKESFTTEAQRAQRRLCKKTSVPPCFCGEFISDLSRARNGANLPAATAATASWRCRYRRAPPGLTRWPGSPGC